MPSRTGATGAIRGSSCRSLADGLTGLAAMAAFTAASPASRRAAVTAGMVGAALPDIDKPTLLWFGFSPFPAAVGRFHSGIQDEALDRYGREAVCAALFTMSALLLLRSRACRASAPQPGQLGQRAEDAFLRHRRRAYPVSARTG